ncbi:MAG: ribonuclease HII [Verrucomicrobia bacterium]|nr:ribonuclease HII [Verrucomicrobiota bacterium]
MDPLNQSIPDFSHEQRIWRAHAGADDLKIVGVDEAGRGPLAGPVVAAAVCFPLALIQGLGSIGESLPGLNDSKKLSAVARERLDRAIWQMPGLGISVGCATPQEIDEFNILGATRLAMRQAVEGLPWANLRILVDGLPLKPAPFEHEAIVKGDSKSISIAAASIVAKVYRDRLMHVIDEECPGYGFARHKGYPTREHMDALMELGPTRHHRRTFTPLRGRQLDLFPD